MKPKERRKEGRRKEKEGRRKERRKEGREVEREEGRKMCAKLYITDNVVALFLTEKQNALLMPIKKRMDKQ